MKTESEYSLQTFAPQNSRIKTSSQTVSPLSLLYCKKQRGKSPKLRRQKKPPKELPKKLKTQLTRKRMASLRLGPPR